MQFDLAHNLVGFFFANFFLCYYFFLSNIDNAIYGLQRTLYGHMVLDCDSTQSVRGQYVLENRPCHKKTMVDNKQ